MQRLSLTFKVSEVNGHLLEAQQSRIASGHASGVTGANIPSHTEPRGSALSQPDADGRAGAAADPSQVGALPGPSGAVVESGAHSRLYHITACHISHVTGWGVLKLR